MGHFQHSKLRPTLGRLKLWREFIRVLVLTRWIKTAENRAFSPTPRFGISTLSSIGFNQLSKDLKMKWNAYRSPKVWLEGWGSTTKPQTHKLLSIYYKIDIIVLIYGHQSVAKSLKKLSFLPSALGFNLASPRQKCLRVKFEPLVILAGSTKVSYFWPLITDPRVMLACILALS